MIDLGITAARKSFSEVVKGASRGERYALSHHGRIVAAVVSAEDLELLRMLEDHFDNLAADEARADAEINGTVSLDDLRAELGI